ncbi:di/tricarboxylate transporter [Lactobacillus colini]|uniref:Di/tricarboxylate transporter n=1 Tax=Lactobacillus colini TaxID=1819254 RepID=A0ABS4MD90_9LACO|nr:hypothetical protein [Lactobacillus colini]MBP2057657.1 di/tricarboxylate transporter [Lactobacillus colini]
MSLGTIFILVLVALVILSVLFAIFKFFIALLPAAIVVALIIWLIYKFKKPTGEGDNYPRKNYNIFNNSGNPTGRKRARNVTVKDVKKDKRGKDNG